MKLVSLTINNYRQFEEAELEFNNAITVLAL